MSLTKMFSKGKKRNYMKLGASLQPKLDLIETVRSELRSENIEVPGIVVAGSQSSGKSSVLESISGIQLPSGNNITTRVPLILRIEMNKDPNLVPHCIISTDADLTQGEKIEIKQTASKISEYTKKIAGDNNEVQDNPIHMKVIQNEIPSMTLIDLPGITHISVNNTQKNIHEETLNLVKKYISNPHIIILCVVPSTEDFANCEAIKLSNEVDPDGKRTIGVVTKVDISPYDITEKLKCEGNNVVLKLGFIGVKNLGPKETFENIKKLRKDEQTFFEEKYPFLERKYWGTDTLITNVVQIQAEFIDNCIPGIVKQLESRLSKLNEELQTYKSNFNNDNEKLSYAITNVVNIKEKYANLIENSSNLNKLFHEYKEDLYKDIPDYFSEMYYSKVENILKENRGIMLSNFLNIQSFKVLFEESIGTQLEKSSEKLMKNVKLLSTQLLEVIISDIFKLFPTMQTLVKGKVKIVIEKLNNELENYVNTLLTVEQLIFTQSKMYTNTVQELRQDDGDNSQNPTANEMIISLMAYHDTVLNRLCDIVPMVVHHYFVYTMINEITTTILPSINIQILNTYMSDDPSVVQERNSRQKTYDKYSEILKQFENL